MEFNSGFKGLITLGLDGGVWQAPHRGCCTAPSLRDTVGPRAGLLHNLGDRIPFTRLGLLPWVVHRSVAAIPTELFRL